MNVEIERNTLFRGAIDKNERMFAALTSRNEDLFEHNGRIIVSGKNSRNENIYLGDVSVTAACQKGVSLKALIEKVRFGAR